MEGGDTGTRGDVNDALAGVADMILTCDEEIKTQKPVHLFRSEPDAYFLVQRRP